MSLLSGEKNMFILESSKEGAHVAKLSYTSFEKLLKLHPHAVLPLAYDLMLSCSPVVRRYAFGIREVHVTAGHLLFRQGTACEAVYIVLNGRLRSVIQRGSHTEFLNEFGRGESVGELELLTSSNRVTSVHAVRDSEIVKLHACLFESLRKEYPETAHNFSRRLSMRFLHSIQSSHFSPDKTSIAHRNLSTIAVVAISDTVPLNQFCRCLAAALSRMGSFRHLTQELIYKRFGDKIFSMAIEYHLANWLSHLEENNRFVLYECDKLVTDWTKLCIRQADCILIVGLGASDPKLGRVERYLETITNRAQKELVLLHDFARRPRNTVKWLNLRQWCTSHHHLRCTPDFLQGLSNCSSLKPPPIVSDFARLARRLANASIGLVLGGGGARGIGHIGIIRAFEEQGIPIDMVGGTSIGSLISALYAEELHVDEVSRRAKEWSVKMSCHWRKLLDLTYPHTSLFSGFQRFVERLVWRHLPRGLVDSLFLHHDGSHDLEDANAPRRRSVEVYSGVHDSDWIPPSTLRPCRRPPTRGRRLHQQPASGCDARLWRADHHRH
jgi:lysophospholipid hydrolase